MIEPMFIISYWRISKIGMWEFVPRQGSMTKYLDECGLLILSTVTIIHSAIQYCIAWYVVVLVLKIVMGFAKIYYD